MTTPRPFSSAGIIWDFSVTEQGHVARYGHFGSDFYKQFMPYGLEIEGQHPPQRISYQVYDLARRFSGKSLTSIIQE
jgi:hypothetical protein